MNKHYVVYDVTGKVLRAGSSPEKFFHLQAHEEEGEFILEVEERFEPGDVYVDVESVPHFIANSAVLEPHFSVSGLSLAITNIPTGTVVKVGTDSVVADEMGVEVEFDVPNTYLIRFFPSVGFRNRKMEVAVG